MAIQLDHSRLFKSIGLELNQHIDLALIKICVFVVASVPFILMIIDSATENLGPNPVESLISRSGTWSLRFLLLAFALTPLRMLTGLNIVNRFRRMLGLYAFFYCSIHLAAFIVFEHAANLDFIVEDILLSEFKQIGLLSYLMLVPLALTSTQSMMRRLGKRWKKLHNTIHVILWLSILHFVLLVKADFRDPIMYGFILFSLQFIRGIYRHYRSMVR